MKTLSERRNEISLKFAKNCLKNEKVKNFFPINNKIKRTRHSENFKVNFASTKRYGNSTIPALQRLLNNEDLKKRIILRRMGC